MAVEAVVIATPVLKPFNKRQRVRMQRVKRLHTKRRQCAITTNATRPPLHNGRKRNVATKAVKIAVPVSDAGGTYRPTESAHCKVVCVGEGGLAGLGMCEGGLAETYNAN